MLDAVPAGEGKLIVLTAPLTETIDHAGYFIQMALASMPKIIEPVIEGMEAPCDMYVFHEFGVPAVLWGPRGGGAHSPDEYVEVDSMVDAARVLFDFTARWCSHS